MPSKDFIEIHKKYKGKWIAMTKENKVVASGDSLQIILKESKKKGFAHPVVMKVPQAVVPLIGCSWLTDDF